MASKPEHNTEPQHAEEVIWDTSRPSFVQLPDWLLFHPEISDGALRTWQVLASYADRQGEAFPGMRTIAERRRRGRTVLFEHLDQLEAAGALRRHARYRETDGGRTSTLYVLAWAHPMQSFQQASDQRKRQPPTPRPENRTTPPSGKPNRGPRPENRTTPGSENRTPPRPENRTPRTKPSNELTPIVPNDTYPQAANDNSLRGTQPPSNPPSAMFTDSPKRRALNPRALGTNPRAVAQRELAVAAESDRLASARSYGTRMASVDPPAWSPDEFREMLSQDHPGDPAYVEAAMQGFLEFESVAATTAADIAPLPSAADSTSTERPCSNLADEPQQLFPI